MARRGPQPCKECGRRPKAPGRHRCTTCQLRHEPIGVQVEASRRRLAMVPPELRMKRVKNIVALAPPGTSWCAGCQSYRDDEDFADGATRCRPCTSDRAHASMVAKTYGLEAGDYDALLELQGGRCAICRARPKSQRLAVDHDHKTGAVRGLLCARCNHDLLGSAWDSMAMATALWHYMNTPPASGQWEPPESAPPLMPEKRAVRPAEASSPANDLVAIHSGKPAQRGARQAATAEERCTLPHMLPVGVTPVPDKPGLWRIYAEPGAPPPF